MNWQVLTQHPGSDFFMVKNQLHKALQLVAATGRSYYPHDAGDIYGSIICKNGILNGKVLVNDSQFTLDIKNFSLVSIMGENEYRFSLSGKSFKDGEHWIREQLAEAGLNPDQYSLELPYAIPDYGPEEIPFQAYDTELYAELSNHYSNAEIILNQTQKTTHHSSNVICWPHHFDIAILATLMEEDDPEDSISIGIGMSPGDPKCEQPYYYLTPWPYPEKNELKDLPLRSGYWHLDDWTGAILRTEDILKSNEGEGQKKIVEEFINDGYQHLCEVLL